MQLWIALPDSARDVPRGFDHYAPKPVSHCGAEVTVFVGSLAGQRSPVRTHTPLLGAQLALPPRGSVELDVDHTFEHGLILDEPRRIATGNQKTNDARRTGP